MNKSIISMTMLAIVYNAISCSYQPPAQAANKKKAPVVINTKVIAATPTNNSRWIGNWDRREWQAGASLEVKSIKNDSLIFSLSSSDGGHTGEIEGSAYVKGNEAVFKSSEIEGCKLVMRISGDSVINITDENTCNGYGGIGVGFSGKFVNQKLLPKEKKQTLISLNILTEQQNAIFAPLVDTNYQRFVDCTEMIEDRSDKKTEEFGAKVFCSGVRGLYTYMEYIIMIDDQNHIWAAVINNQKVFYYTNSKDYINKLPNTIEEWRTGFKDYPLMYASK
jgi:hypothetical protein